MQFLIRAFLPAHPISKIGQQRYRVLGTECEAIDNILRGDLAAATDVLIGRIKAIQRSVVDGHDRAGRWFEIIPGRDNGTSLSLTDETVAAGSGLPGGDLSGIRLECLSSLRGGNIYIYIYIRIRLSS